mgnify:CR=1 FL=1
MSYQFNRRDLVRGLVGGDAFVTGSLGLVIALTLLFALFGWKIAALYLGLGLSIAIIVY